MKVGIDVEPQEGMTWERWAELARRVEELGFESLWRSDHLFSVVGQVQRPALEAWTSLTYLATATSRIRFGTLVTPVTFRDPAVFALTAAAIDALAGGRLEVGLGVGWNRAEHEAFGIPLPPPAERFERLEETIEVLRALWTQDEANFGGKHFQLRGAHGHPKPAQRPHPPIVIGGTGEKRSLRTVARFADEWNAHGVTLDLYRQKRAALDRHCEEIGRDPATIRRSVAGACIVAETRTEIERQLKIFAETFPLDAPAFFPSAATSHSIEDMRDRGWFIGTPDEVVEQIEAFAAEGVHRVMMQLMPNDDAQLDALAESVLPHLQQTHRRSREVSGAGAENSRVV